MIISTEFSKTKRIKLQFRDEIEIYFKDFISNFDIQDIV